MAGSDLTTTPLHFIFLVGLSWSLPGINSTTSILDMGGRFLVTLQYAPEELTSTVSVIMSNAVSASLRGIFFLALIFLRRSSMDYASFPFSFSFFLTWSSTACCQQPLEQ